MAEDRADDIVEVMRDATRESTDRFHAACVLEIHLQALTFLHEVFSHKGISDGVESRAQQPDFSILPDDPRSQRVEAENGYVAAARAQPRDACPATRAGTNKVSFVHAGLQPIHTLTM